MAAGIDGVVVDVTYNSHLKSYDIDTTNFGLIVKKFSSGDEVNDGVRISFNVKSVKNNRNLNFCTNIISPKKGQYERRVNHDFKKVHQNAIFKAFIFALNKS